MKRMLKCFGRSANGSPIYSLGLRSACAVRKSYVFLTTFYLAVKNITSYIHGEDNAGVFNKSVSVEQMRKATASVLEPAEARDIIRRNAEETLKIYGQSR